MADHQQHIVIVGAGIGGLSAAIRLAARGHSVQMFERQPQVGGKLNQVAVNGFSFDTGPSLITMPFVLRELFRSAGRRLEDYLQLQPLDITCRYFYHDGLVLNAWCDEESLIEEFARLNPHDGAALRDFITYTGRIYQAAADPFLYHSLGSPLDVMGTFARYVVKGHQSHEEDGEQTEEQADEPDEPDEPDEQTNSRDTGKALTNPFTRFKAVLSALSPMTLDECVENFFQDPHLRQLFDRYATYNGSSPYQVGSVYSLIPYVELASGGWYLCGGIYTLAQALGKLAAELGVTIETDCNVQRILVEYGSARGIVLDDGRVVRGDIVIANSDVVTTHRELLSPSVIHRRHIQRLKKLEPSCSGFVLLLGMDKQYPQLSHHNIFFSRNYRAEFDDLFKRHIPILDPTIYVCSTSRTDPTQAPPGHENLFVLVNAPYLTEQSNWQRDAAPYRDHILDILAQFPQAGLEDIRSHIVTESLLTPEDFRRLYGANQGSIYGLSSNQRMAPFTRPGNRSPRIHNLYFVGGSTHPGGGIPLVTLSGKIVAQMIEEDYA